MELINGKTYRLESRADRTRSLNVYGTSPKVKANVCLYKSDNNDVCQQWLYTENGNDKYFVCKGALYAGLALYTGSNTTDKITNYNAIIEDMSIKAFPIVAVSTSDYNTSYVQIRLANYSDKYLTANQGSNGTANGKDVNAKGNVYWYKGGLTDYSQDLKPVLLDEKPDDKNEKYYWPTESKKISNNFSEKHIGIDISPLQERIPGDEVYAYMEGTVSMITTNTTSNPDEGYTVRIHHTNPLKNGYKNICTQYMHLQSVPKVKPFEKVVAGQLIGYMGNTGNVTPKPTTNSPGAGTHLHFEVRGGSEEDFPIGDKSKYGYNTGIALNPNNYLNLI